MRLRNDICEQDGFTSVPVRLSLLCNSLFLPCITRGLDKVLRVLGEGQWQRIRRRDESPQRWFSKTHCLFIIIDYNKYSVDLRAE